MPQTRYVINVSFDINGEVGESNVVGALFGQTKEMLGVERCLSDSVVGYINTDLQSDTDKETGRPVTRGTSALPMHADSTICTDIAACIEEIDNVGPFESAFVIESITDVMAEKKANIARRSKEMHKKWLSKTDGTE